MQIKRPELEFHGRTRRYSLRMSSGRIRGLEAITAKPATTTAASSAAPAGAPNSLQGRYCASPPYAR